MISWKPSFVRPAGDDADGLIEDFKEHHSESLGPRSHLNML